MGYGVMKKPEDKKSSNVGGNMPSVSWDTLISFSVGFL